jgi:hypothetical protein
MLYKNSFYIATDITKVFDQNKMNWHVQNELWFQANKKGDYHT